MVSGLRCDIKIDSLLDRHETCVTMMCLIRRIYLVGFFFLIIYLFFKCIFLRVKSSCDLLFTFGTGIYGMVFVVVLLLIERDLRLFDFTGLIFFSLKFLIYVVWLMTVMCLLHIDLKDMNLKSVKDNMLPSFLLCMD